MAAGLAMVLAVAMAWMGIGAASTAQAAGPGMKVALESLNATVANGGQFTYEVRIECSNLVEDECVEPDVRIKLPQNADGSVVATTYQPSSNYLRSPAVTGGGYMTLRLKTLKPGTTRQFNVVFAIPNYTVLPGTKLDSTVEVTYSDGATPPVTVPGSNPATVTTTAKPQLTVSKKTISPSSEDKVRPDEETTYLLTACVPTSGQGLLNLKSLKVVDTFDPSPGVEVRDADGGTVSGNTITWTIDSFAAGEGGRCGTATAFTKTVTMYYPASMVPVTPGAQFDTYAFENKLDVTGVAIDDSTVGGSATVDHAFFIQRVPSTNGTIGLSAVKAWSPNERAVPGDNYNSVLQDSTTLKHHWDVSGHWFQVGGQDPASRRNLMLADVFPCISGATANSPTTTAGFSNSNTGSAFANDGAYVPANVDPSKLCGAPSFKTTQFEIGNNSAAQMEEVKRYFAALNVIWKKPGTSEWGVAQFKAPAGGLTDRFINPYAADGGQNLNIPADAVVVEWRAIYRNVPAGQSFRVFPNGYSTQGFADTDIFSSTNSMIVAVSDLLDAQGNLGSDKSVKMDFQWSAQANFRETVMGLNITKDRVGDASRLTIGDTATWKVTVSNTGSTTPVKPVAYDVLPVGLDYVAGSASWTGAQTPTEKVEKVTIDGVERTKVTWTFGEDFANGATATVQFDTVVNLNASEGSNSGTSGNQYAAAMNQYGNTSEGLNGTDKFDLDGDGNTTERVVEATQSWTVVSQSGATVEKFVKGSQDSDWVKNGLSAATVDNSGTTTDYRLSIKNENASKLANMVVYDVLPHVGDTAIGDDLVGQDRESAFAVLFREVKALPAGVTVQYSTSYNPCRPELFANGGQGACDATWSSTVPSDPTEVKSLKFTIASLGAGAEYNLDFTGDAPKFVFDAKAADPMCATNPENLAWNNLAFRTDRVRPDGTFRTLLPAEAPKVSVREICGEIGDYAWFDTNRDGVQDDSEKPAPGVVFQLVNADTGQVVKDADGNPVEATTGADGKYSFTVPLGNWAVQVKEVPEGYTFTKANEGDDARDSDVPALNTPTAPVTIDKDNLKNPTLDAGLVSKAVSVGDYVWIDENYDGIQTDGEPGIPGVVLVLTGPDGNPVTDINGNPVGPLTTDADGKYVFADLPALKNGESYTVSIDRDAQSTKDALGKLIPTQTGQGNRGNDSSDWTTTTEGLTEDGDKDLTLDFGFVPTVSVGDYIWVDKDHDGTQDPGEPGIPGVTVTITRTDGQPVLDKFGDPVTVTVTGPDGEYSFDDLQTLPPGTHYVVHVDPKQDPLKPYQPTKPGVGDDRSKDSSTNEAESKDLTEAGDRDSTLDFGFVESVRVGDYVFIDKNYNGTQDAGDTPVKDVLLRIVGPDGQPVTDVFGDPVGDVRTDAQGKYLFENLPVLEKGQSYTVSIVRDDAKTQEALGERKPTKPGVGGDRGLDSSDWQASTEGLTKNQDEDLTLDFGFVDAVSVGDYVWVDKNHDGQQSNGEPGIPGVQLELRDSDGNPVVDTHGNPVVPVVTDADGKYEFTDLPTLPDGKTYTVIISADQPTDALKDYLPTNPGVGDDKSKDSSTDEATSWQPLSENGQSDNTLDFGFVESVKVGDFVWFDVNKDGTQSAGEPGIPDVWLNLVGPDGKPVTDVFGNPVEPVKTGPNGEYLFENLPVLEAGQSYTVKIDREKSEPVLGKYSPTKAGVGDRAKDSSNWAADSQGLTGNGQKDLTLDFGFVPTEPVVDIEKVDVEGNDADTADDSVTLPAGTTELVFTVKNLGDEDLTKITVSDKIIKGSGTVTGLQCTFPDGTTGTTWDGRFKVGDSFECKATLKGVKAGEHHVDTASVDAVGYWSGTPTKDTDDYHGDVPEPGISIVKKDVDGNDANSSADPVKLDRSRTTLVFTITNTGEEALKDVVVSDKVVRGQASVKRIVCVFPDGSKGTRWKGPFEVGDSFECTAELVGLTTDVLHTDIASVTGTGVETGEKVGDDDPYNAVRVDDTTPENPGPPGNPGNPPTTGLPNTGAPVGAWMVGLGLLLAVAGAVVLLARRRQV